MNTHSKSNLPFPKAIAITLAVILGVLFYLYINPHTAYAHDDHIPVFSPPTIALEFLLAPFGDDLSVFYKNLDTGFVFRHNAERVYFSASVPKAFFALYIYQKAERGEVDLDSLVTFLEEDYMGGSGVIRHNSAFGDTFTQRELLRLNLSESDNIATLMLRRVHGIEGYRRFLADIGGNPDFVRGNVFNSQLTANEAGHLAYAIFSYIQSGGRYSAEFDAHLLDNQFPFIVSDYPIASKTGWTRPTAWHDMAIIYAPSPFILVILSARDGWTDQDYEDFAAISHAFHNFNYTWFETPPTPAPTTAQEVVSSGYEGGTLGQDGVLWQEWISFWTVAGVVVLFLLFILWRIRRYLRG